MGGLVIGLIDNRCVSKRTMQKCFAKFAITITNHGFLRGSNWLTCHFLLMDMCISLKAKGFECHMYLLINQFDCNDLFN